MAASTCKTLLPPFVTVLLFQLLFFLEPQEARSAQLPGLLHVSSSNSRYFEDPSGNIVYLTGAYDWNFAATMSPSTVDSYLNYVASHGQNFLRVSSQDYNGTALQTNYFSELASRVSKAAQLGIYVEVQVFPFVDGPPFNDLSFDELYTRRLVQAVGHYDNVLFEVGNELYTVDLDQGTVGWFANRIVDVINDEQKALGLAHHPVGISDFRGHGGYYQAPDIVAMMLNSHADFVQVGWSQLGGHSLQPLPDYGGQKVSIPDSDHIFPYHLDHHWVWKTFTTGGNPSILDGNDFYPNYVVPDDPSDTLGAQLTYDARIRMGDTRSYALKMNLKKSTPRPDLSSTGFALADPGNEYLIYQPDTGSFQVNLLAASYTIEWFDPTTRNSTTSTLTASSTGNRTFSTPLDPNHDAVLFLKRTGTVPPPPALACNQIASNAFTGCYYSDMSLSHLVLVRTDAAINFDWGSGSPDPSIGSDGFSVHWQGNFNFSTGAYKFTATADDGVRVYVDGRKVLDQWKDQSSPTTYTTNAIILFAGTHRIEMDYYEHGGGATAKLTWARWP
jgi:PA14 domain-containing protein